jgi:hypothetical protein
MGNGGLKAWKIGAFGVAALLLAMVGPGVATVSAKPAAQLTLLKRLAVAPAPIVVVVPVAEAVAAAPAAVAAPVVARRHLRRLKQHELDTGLMLASAELIKKHHAKRFGSEIEVEIQGKSYVARIERHFHPEGGAIKPWGYHPGVSLFAVE